MIHKDLTFDNILSESKEKEKSLDRNFALQSVMILISFIYISLDTNEFNKVKGSIPETFQLLLINKQILPIIIPALFTYFFARMGHNLYSYLFFRKSLFDILTNGKVASKENIAEFPTLYSSYTNSSFFEALNLFVLNPDDTENQWLEKNNRLFKLYTYVFTVFLGLNHAFTLFYLTGFVANIYIKIIFILLILTIIILCYTVFLETYSTKVKRKFILSVIITTMFSLVSLYLFTRSR